MRIPMQVTIHGIKESVGEIEGRAYNSLTFHCEVDLKENGAGRSLGRVTRPFKMKDAAKDFDKWSHLANSFPIVASAEFEMVATRDEKSELVLCAIAPAARPQAKAA